MSPDPTGPEAPGPHPVHVDVASARSETSPRVIFVVVAVVALVADVVTKVLAVSRLDPDAPVVLLGGLLRLQLIRNPGAAFSQGESFTWVFAVAAVLVLGFVLIRLVPRLGHPGWAVALGLLVGGVAGNLADRIFRSPGVFRGHVVDFLRLPHWPIFNVADMCITTAAVMVLVLSLFRNVGVDGRHPGAADESTSSTVDDATIPATRTAPRVADET